MRPFHVHRAHAGEHRVLHRAAEVGLETRALCICRRRRTWRQVPSSIHSVSTDSADHPEQGVADQPIDVRNPSGAQHDSVGPRRDRQLLHDRAGRAPGPASAAPSWPAPCLGVEQRDRVAVRDLARDEVAQQGLDRVLGDQRPGEGAAVDQRHLDLEHGLAMPVQVGRRVHRLALVARGEEGCPPARWLPFSSGSARAVVAGAPPRPGGSAGRAPSSWRAVAAIGGSSARSPGARA